MYSMFFLFILGFVPIYKDTLVILEKIDNVQKNFSFLSFSAAMDIQSESRKLSKKISGMIDTEEDKVFIEYTNPQDKGTRYLKMSNHMWIYLPDLQDILKISGHLLRDSMMGSDTSYVDMMDQRFGTAQYNAEKVIPTNFNNSNYLLLTRSKEPDNTSCIKQDSYLIYQITAYAKELNTERLIKQFVLKDFVSLGSVSTAQVVEIKELRKKNSQTTITYKDLKMNAPLDNKIFTKVYLE